MRRAFLLVCTIAASLVGVSVALGGVTTHEFNVPIATSYEACNGEIVDATGTADTLVVTTTTGNGREVIVEHVTVDLTGVGETSGGTYHNIWMSNSSNTFDYSQGAAEYTLVFHVHDLGQGVDPNFRYRMFLHTTINATGESTGTHLEVVSDCQ